MLVLVLVCGAWVMLSMIECDAAQGSISLCYEFNVLFLSNSAMIVE